MFTNSYAMMGAIMSLKRMKDNNITGSDRNKAILLPLLVNNPIGSIITSDLATKKAIETKKLHKVQEEHGTTQVTSVAALLLSDDMAGVLEKIKTTVKDALNAADVKKEIEDKVVPLLDYRADPVILDALQASRPEFASIDKKADLKFDNLLKLFKRP